LGETYNGHSRAVGSVPESYILQRYMKLTVQNLAIVSNFANCALARSILIAIVPCGIAQQNLIGSIERPGQAFKCRSFFRCRMVV